MLRLTVVALLVGSVAAIAEPFQPNHDAFQKLLGSSTLVEGRGLANNNNNNYNNYNYNYKNQQYGLTQVIGNLNLKYTRCTNIYSAPGQWYNRGGGNGGGGGGYSNQNGGLWSMGVVEFELREGCGGTLVGKYATNLVAFVNSYLESTMSADEEKCESYLQGFCYNNCENNYDVGGDAESCYLDCFKNSKETSGTDYSYCAKYYNGEENRDFEIQSYLMCSQLKNNNYDTENYNNEHENFDWNEGYKVYPAWDGVYRTGAYCDDDGESIKLGIFYDPICAIQAPTSVYHELFGSDLPYSEKLLIPKKTCISCVDSDKQSEQQQDQNSNNANYKEPNEFCVQSYQQAGKCEDPNSTYVEQYGAVTSGCEFVISYLPKVFAANSERHYRRSRRSATAFAWIFAVTTLFFGAYTYFLYRKIKSRHVELHTQDQDSTDSSLA